MGLLLTSDREGSYVKLSSKAVTILRGYDPMAEESDLCLRESAGMERSLLTALWPMSMISLRSLQGPQC